MYCNFWFLIPVAGFLVLSVVRVIIAISSFDKDGSMPEHSFEIVSNTNPTVDIFGALLAVAAAVLGGETADIPEAAAAFASAIAILFAISAVTGYYMKAMVPSYQNADDKLYRFPNSIFPCTKAVFGAAQFVMILSAAIFALYLVFSFGGRPPDSQPAIDPPAEMPSSLKR